MSTIGNVLFGNIAGGDSNSYDSVYVESDAIALELFFDVISSTSNSQWLSLNLGAPNPLKKRFPLYRAIARHCGWVFKSRECNYSGPDATCDRTLADCRSKENSVRFGGRPGLDSNVRFA